MLIRQARASFPLISKKLDYHFVPPPQFPLPPLIAVPIRLLRHPQHHINPPEQPHNATHNNALIRRHDQEIKQTDSRPDARRSDHERPESLGEEA